MSGPMSGKEFSVAVIYDSGHRESVRKDVSSGEASEAFKHYTDPKISAAQRLGLVKRVILSHQSHTIREWVLPETRETTEKRIEHYLSEVLRILEANRFDPEEIKKAKAAFNTWQPILDEYKRERKEKENT